MLQKQFNYEYKGYTEELQSNQFDLEAILGRGEGEIRLSWRMSCD